MKLEVRVKTNQKENCVKMVDESTFVVQTTAQPIDNNANEAVIQLLADYFDTAKSNIKIIRGHTGKLKLVQIS